MAKKSKPAKSKPAKGSRTSSGRGAKGVFARVLRTLAVVFVFAYASLAAIGWFASDALIFPVPPPGYTDAEPGLTMIPIPGGGRAASLWLPKRGATRAILYLHGNRDDLGRMRSRLAFMREFTGCSVLAIDYPGYGLSPGAPSESATLRAAEAAFAHLTLLRGYEPDSVAVWGYSLGSGPAVHLAAHRRVGGLILEAPFTSTFRTVLPVNPLPFDKFDNLAIIDRVQCPLLILHGDRDRVVPFAHGERLYAGASGAPFKRFLRLRGAGHVGIPGDGNGVAYRAEILGLLERTRAAPEPRS